MPTVKEMGDTLHQIADWIHGLEAKLEGLTSHFGAQVESAVRKGPRKAAAVAQNAGRQIRRRRKGLGAEMEALLRKNGKPMMPVAIRDALGAKATSVSTTLHRLAKAGKVKRDKNGRGWTA